MILPTKHLAVDKSAIGAAALVLRSLSGPATVSELWERAADTGIATFDQYIMGLTFLHLLGAVEFRDGRLIRSD
jgi:ABC-three component (ABC-3C) system Middle Component 6